MIQISSDAIHKCCKATRTFFPSTFVLQILKDASGDRTLSIFPKIRAFEGASSSEKFTSRNERFTREMFKELTEYFSEKQDVFLNFLRLVPSRAMKGGTISKNKIDDFITEVNPILLVDSRIRIESYEAIHKLVQNRSGQESSLNINVPDYIEDYFSEALDCLSEELYRSSILFCTFALEGSLRSKYADMVDKDQAYARSTSFSSLIDWGIRQNLVINEKFYEEGLKFIREYRNDLAHFNRNKTSAITKISREHAKRNSKLIIDLVQLLINNIFY